MYDIAAKIMSTHILIQPGHKHLKKINQVNNKLYRKMHGYAIHQCPPFWQKAT